MKDEPKPSFNQVPLFVSHTLPSDIVDVVFSLASFQAKHDAPFMNAQEQKNGIDRMVISMFKDFLEKADGDSRVKFSEVIKLNKNLTTALNATSAAPSIIFI